MTSTAEQERAVVVAWLRRTAGKCSSPQSFEAVTVIADAIERGEHLRGGE